MKKAILISMLLASTPIHAADLTLNDCMEIRSALVSLDHYDDQGKQKQYKLGALRITIGLNIAALRHVPEVVEKARLDLIAEVGNGKTIVQEFTPIELSTLNNKYREMLNKPCDVKPGRIKLSDLKLGDGAEENPIPPSVLASLVPILDQ